jgi:type I restriction enzyme M protein
VEGVRSVEPAEAFVQDLAEAKKTISAFFKASKDDRAKSAFGELEAAVTTLANDGKEYGDLVARIEEGWSKGKRDLANLKAAIQATEKSVQASHDLVRDIDHAAKLFVRAVDLAEKELGAKENGVWSGRDVKAAQKTLKAARDVAAEQLKLVRYFYRHAHWLVERFPDAELRDVAGLVKLVSQNELEKHDWSLTPGRYVGVAPEEEDEDFDFEETIRKIHVELTDLNADAAELAAKIAKNFEGLGI